jgi:hypothetical protein
MRRFLLPAGHQTIETARLSLRRAAFYVGPRSAIGHLMVDLLARLFPYFDRSHFFHDAAKCAFIGV